MPPTSAPSASGSESVERAAEIIGDRRATQRTLKLGAEIEVPYPIPTSPAASRVGKGNRRSNTRPERAAASELHRRGRRFRRDYPIRVGGLTVRPDIVFTKARVAVFVDGCFWHACPVHGRMPKSNEIYWSAKLGRNVARDRLVDDALARAGWAVVRVWEHVLTTEVSDEVERAIANSPA